jgi:hypothetical protein
MTAGIYRILNTKNSKNYVGSSVNIESRWKQHINSLKAGKHRNQYLQRSFNEHGIDKFSFSILEELSKDFLLEREKYWMDLCRSCDKNFGYNLYKDPTRPGYEKGCFSTEMRDRFGVARLVDFVSPDGIVYKDIKNVTRFAEEHGLHPVAMNEVARGKRIVHKGWILSGNQDKLSKSLYRKRRIGKLNVDLVDNLGNVYHITNLQQFCENHELKYTTLHNLIQGLTQKSCGYRLLKNTQIA